MADSDSAASLETKLQALEAQLGHAQRLATLGTLLGTTTHEFNNILMTIINYAKMGMRNRDAATRDKAFERILDAGNRASRITAGVLSLARTRSDELEPTKLTNVVEEALVLLEREMRKHKVRVDKRLEPTPPALANATQIQQVLMNLMVNARQAMPRGGVVTLKLWHDQETNMICLMVRDNGRGISPDRLPHIFDPYYSTKQGPDATGKGGTGLGLANCKDIVEAHRGRIRVDSTPGVGTAFVIKLPAAASTEKPVEPRPVPKPTMRRRPAAPSAT